MPNHVANEISGPWLGEIRQVLAGPKNAVDFNQLVQMPDGMGVEAHGGIEMAAEFACRDIPEPHRNPTDISQMTDNLHLSNMMRNKSPLEFDDEEWGKFIQLLQNKRQHGHYNWYRWCIEFWGTKWNAYDIEDRGDSIYFETAWNFPDKIFQALCVRLPAADFVWKYADEDFGRNLGIWRVKDGDRSFSAVLDEPKDWAARLHGWSEDQIAEWRKEIAEDVATAH